MASEAIWLEVILLVSGALFGIALFLCGVGLAIYYYLDKNDD